MIDYVWPHFFQQLVRLSCTVLDTADAVTASLAILTVVLQADDVQHGHAAAPDHHAVEKHDRSVFLRSQSRLE